ncbi:GrpB family protein [Brevibacillus sp. NRS-1366]|uniref:GrpB family protein n=1 Tax=Brevibacillus sp. NRS-1366 TaxID=3233899 RepID=UPI003D203AA5
MEAQVIENYEKWKQMFREEAQRIKDIFADELIAIHHIGSTSVLGLNAKPILDIMPIVKDILRIDSFNEQMIGIGYECMGELGLKGRRYFRKGKEKRTLQVHVFQVDNKEHINRHLVVRDYLQAHFKETVLDRDVIENSNNTEAYSNAKNAFMKELERMESHFYLNS